MSSIKYHPEIEKLEHDDASAPETKRVLAYGWDASGLQKVKLNVDANGKLNVNSTASLAGTTLPISGATEGVGVAILDGSGNQITSFGGGTQYTEGDTDATLTGTISMAEGPSNTVTPLQVDASKHLQVDIAAASTDITVQDGGGSLTVDNNGTFAVQENGAALTALQLIDDTVATTASAIPTKGIAISGTDGTNARVIKTDTSGELQVDVLTMPTTTVTATNLSTNIAQMNGVTVTMGNGVSGTGVQRVTLASDSTGQVALAAGTNGIGKLTANSGVDIGDVTLTAGTAAVGSILPPDTDVTAHTNYARKYYTNAGAVTDGIIWSPAAGKRWHIVTMYIQTSAAATITLEDDKAGGDDPVWKGEIAANSGVTLSFTEHYPMASGEDAADLIITTSAGNVYVTCVGYEI